VKLAEIICAGMSVPKEHLMLLRHSNERIRKLTRFGGTVEEYTAIQPVGSKYDFQHHPKFPTHLVAVIVEDKLYGVFRITGVEKEGTTHTLGNRGYQAFEREIKKPERPARQYGLLRIPSRVENQPVIGWERRARTTVQRCDGEFFDQIEIESAKILSLPTVEEVQIAFEKDVQRSRNDNIAARRARLATASSIPPKIQVQTTAFIRSSDVVAEVLERANGTCEGCGMKAPFIRRLDGTPYLEVHHKIPLAQQGKDEVANATALCPNCHRRLHFGPLPFMPATK
jgi:hypothetical protein